MGASEKALKMADLAIEALENTKAEEIKSIDISEVSVMSDVFILACGNSRTQIRALADHVDEALSKAGYQPKNIEGYDTCKWILMDYGDIIIHVFDNESRKYYDLDRIWRDGVEINVT
ncbi:ribosome silencing factor [Butyrivibrio sp. MC2013]|uniref:ribosome silencing factor n=1 Tax=Butyrivibrio sp. MC2013 TaxID=1280686 RepID=UPI0004014D2F|nr:ribosome silencing factor [Butyrivibrio sp. MC2013]